MDVRRAGPGRTSSGQLFRPIGYSLLDDPAICRAPPPVPDRIVKRVLLVAAGAGRAVVLPFLGKEPGVHLHGPGTDRCQYILCRWVLEAEAVELPPQLVGIRAVGIRIGEERDAVKVGNCRTIGTVCREAELEEVDLCVAVAGRDGIEIGIHRRPRGEGMGRANDRPHVMGCICDLPAAQVNMRPAAGQKALAGSRKEVAELGELDKIFGEDHVVNTVFVLDLALRDDHDAGVVLKERFPPVLPVRLEGIARTEYTDPLGHAPFDQLFRLHEAGNRNRVRGMDVQVGRGEHGYVPDWILRDIRQGMVQRLVIFFALEKTSFQVMISPLAPTLPPMGGSWRITIPRHYLNGKFPHDSVQ